MAGSKKEQKFKQREEHAQVQREREAVWPECDHYIEEGQKPSSVITKEHIPLSSVPGVLNKPTCRDPLLEERINILRRIFYKVYK